MLNNVLNPKTVLDIKSDRQLQILGFGTAPVTIDTYKGIWKLGMSTKTNIWRREGCKKKNE